MSPPSALLNYLRELNGTTQWFSAPSHRVQGLLFRLRTLVVPPPGSIRAPLVRNGAEGRELATARWGMPCSQQAPMEATKKRAAKLEAKGKPVDFRGLLGGRRSDSNLSTFRSR